MSVLSTAVDGDEFHELRPMPVLSPSICGNRRTFAIGAARRARSPGRAKARAHRRVARSWHAISGTLATRDYRLYEDLHSAGRTISSGALGGFGTRVHGHILNDPTVKGGTYYPITVKKHLRAQEIAAEFHCPASIPLETVQSRQDEVFPDRGTSGESFSIRRTRRARIAQIAARTAVDVALRGACASDENVIARGRGRIFLGGPPLVKRPLYRRGRERAEELGGADVHCRESGVTDHYAENDAHGPAIPAIVAQLRAPAGSREPPVAARGNCSSIRPTLRRAAEPRASPTTCAESSRDWWTASWKTFMATCHGLRAYQWLSSGHHCQYDLFPESALKAMYCIELCAREHIPLVFLQNITGFMVGERRRPVALRVMARRW